MSSEDVDRKAWKWGLGLSYIIAVATIWIAASFVVQSVVDAGVSPFLVTYICNSLFVVLIPIVEIGRYLEDSHGGLLFWRSEKSKPDLEGRLGESEQAILLNDAINEVNESLIIEEVDVIQQRNDVSELLPLDNQVDLIENVDNQLDEKGRWTRYRVAKSNTILSSASSLFTFLASLAFFGERFTWFKLFSILLCMGGTIIVSLGDSQSGLKTVASNPLLGDVLALVSAGMYAVYITLIRKKLLDDDGKSEEASMTISEKWLL